MNNEFRKQIIEFVAERATDEELLQLASEVKARRQRESSLESELGNYIGVNRITGKSKDQAAVAAPKGSVSAPDEVTSAPAAPKNVVPPGNATARIGSDTKALIERHLKGGPDTADKIAVIIKRTPAQTRDLLKLLHDRKLVVFDGAKYNLV